MPRIEGTLTHNGFRAPLLTVTLETPQHKRFQGRALVDSGADVTIIPNEWIEALGIPFSDLDPIDEEGSGAGGRFEYRMVAGTVRWRRWVICGPTIFVAASGCLENALLGRDDFMRKFVTRFNWHTDPPTFDIDPVT